MQVVATAVNRAFEAIGSPIKATVEDGDLFVRDLIVTPSEDGMVEIFEASRPESPMMTMAAADTATLAGVIALHVVRRIIAQAIGD